MRFISSQKKGRILKGRVEEGRETSSHSLKNQIMY